MSQNKIRKTVSFNVKNQGDVQMLKHIENKNFSGYVKDLIERDMKKKVIQTDGGGLKVILK